MGRLDGKVAIVTGSSSGFGRAIARTYAREGAKGVCADLISNVPKAGFETDPELDTDAAIRENGGDAIFVKCDVTKDEDVKNLFRETIKKYGTLDILTNNAGVYRGANLMYKIPLEDLEACLEVNVKGMWRMCQQAIPIFIEKNKGKIVNIVSTAGLNGTPTQAPYNTSKGAAANLTQTMAIEYGVNNINVNAACPTYCKTSLTKQFFEDPTFRKMVEDNVPMHRWGETQDVANLALFLASEESDYITGALIPVDGGEVLSCFTNKDFGFR